jgi:tRNA acetyltransferase TAN1
MAANLLLISTPRGLEKEAASELFALLTHLGDEEPQIERTGVSGLLKVATTLPLEDVIAGVRRVVEEEPWQIRYILRLIPVERLVPSRIEDIRKAVEELKDRIGEGESFRVTVEKRHTTLSSRELIEAAASQIARKVDLEDPDWVVLIEVVGRETGVSVVRPDKVLSIVKLKRR